MTEENNFKIKFWLSVALQIVILISFILIMQYRLISGEKVRLKLIPPKDPLSLFQGHYLILDYEISELDSEKYYIPSGVGSGETVYITLSDNGSYHEPVSISISRPKGEIFIKGTVTSSGWSGNLRVKYGIENYFIPEDKAEEIEEKFFELLRDEDNDLLVEIRIDGSGNAMINKFLVDGEEIRL